MYNIYTKLILYQIQGKLDGATVMQGASCNFIWAIL